MRSQSGSTSSAPSTVTSTVPASRPTRGTPTSRARVAVSWEVGTPRARKPARTRSPSARTNAAAARPEPRPTTAPSRTSARARSASKAMAAGSTSSLMGVRWPALSSVWPTRLLPALGEKLGDHAGPARLVAGPQAGPVVAVEVLVEERQAAPVRVALELLGAAEDRAAPVRPREKEAVETPRDIRGHVPEAHEAARAGRARDLEVVAEEVMELLQRRPQGRVPDQLGPPHEPLGRGRGYLAASQPPLSRGAGRAPPGLRRHREVPARPALARPAALLRVLPRRQRGRPGGQPPDGLDRRGRQASLPERGVAGWAIPTTMQAT